MNSPTPDVRTPTEDLILDVLVARYRLGTTLWTFPSHVRPALLRLQEKSLVTVNSGVTAKTLRASLTDRAILEHGTTWFQLSITMDQLPTCDTYTPLRAHWSRKHLELLVELPQQGCHTDPRAINAAHLLMIRMISAHHPIYLASAGPDHGVLLTREKDLAFVGTTTVEISPDGLNFQLDRTGADQVSTGSLDRVLSFTTGRAL